MKRKFFKSLLFVAALAASSGTFVSCSDDYDDDISSLQTEVNSLKSALESSKTSLQAEIKSLQSKLETAQAELTAAIENAKAAGEQAVAQEIQDRVAAVAALEAKIATANETLTNLQTLVESKASAEDLAALAGQLNAIETTLGAKFAELAGEDNKIKTELAQAVAELKIQSEALTKAQDRLTELEGQLPALKTDLEAAKTTITELQGEIKSLKEAVEACKGDIAELKTKMQELSNKVDGFSGAINQLNIWIAKQLRSLVFAPRCYYWGIEATYITSNDGIAYTLPSVDAESETDRYPYTETFAPMLEESIALYHMNPSTAVINPANVRIAEVVDANYTRALADVKLDVVTEGVKAENGDLMVPLKVNNPSLLKNIDNDSQVTVFAVEYAYGDTTITSDYVALLAKQVQVRYKIAHTNNAPSLVQGAPVGQDACNSASTTEYGHLMQTKAIAKANAAQDACKWNGSIDLTKCVELHKSIKGAEAADPVDTSVGYTYTFELTSDDDSKYAEINAETGVLTPKDLTGKYSSIGKKPLVRVSVKDANGNVLDYGYILCEIADDICNYVKNAKIDWSKAGVNKTYWFAGTSWDPGFDAIHLNTQTPEDNPVAAPTALPISVKVANTFTGNHVDISNGLITVNDNDGDPFTVSVSNVKFVFHKNNNGKQYVVNGKTYELQVSADALTLNAVENGTTQEIAVLTDGTVDTQILTYQPTNFAKALLNIADRDHLGDAISASIGLSFDAECEIPSVEYEKDPFTAYFVRPIDVSSIGYEIQDASSAALQTIPLESLISYNDWREDKPWKPNYRAYYGVQAVYIDGISSGDNLRMNPDVTTNQDGTWKPLADVNDAVDLIYKVGTSGAYIEYRNNQAGVNQFEVKIPVSVTYTWGTVTSIITVIVKKTA